MGSGVAERNCVMIFSKLNRSIASPQSDRLLGSGVSSLLCSPVGSDCGVRRGQDNVRHKRHQFLGESVDAVGIARRPAIVEPYIAAIVRGGAK